LYENLFVLKITFLGTGTSQGLPVIGCKCDVCTSEDPLDKRLRCSAMIEYKGKTLVIDSGPDFRQQMLREKVERLDAVIFTHEHKDHIAGLDDIRSYNWIQQKPMDVYADERVQEAITRREYAYVFEDKLYPGIPKMNLHLIEGNKNFFIDDIEIIPIRVLHYQLPIFGYRIHDLTYIVDASFISDEEKEKIKGSEILVLNALRKKKHISHFCLDEALEVISEMKPRKAYLTHLSHMLGRHQDIQKELPENVFLAYDGLSVSI